MSKQPRRLYCYVDETGQDIRSSSFIVVTVVVVSDVIKIRQLLRNIEEKSGKVQHKWTKTTVARRVSYCQQVIDRLEFIGTIRYSRFPKPTEYPESTYLAISQAVKQETGHNPFQAYVFIDGLPYYERQRASRYLRAFNKNIKKVRGLRDNVDEFIRLADAFAGFIRANGEGESYTRQLYKRAIRKGVIVEISV